MTNVMNIAEFRPLLESSLEDAEDGFHHNFNFFPADEHSTQNKNKRWKLHSTRAEI
jgi:hypothetical protein